MNRDRPSRSSCGGMSEAQAQLEMAAVGDATRGQLEFVENISVLPQQHLMVFRRK